jgi:hypothetical protein
MKGIFWSTAAGSSSPTPITSALKLGEEPPNLSRCTDGVTESSLMRDPTSRSPKRRSFIAASSITT